MGLIELTNSLRLTEPSSVCLGTFDGVHLAHRALISACVAEANIRHLIPTAFTFEKPPALLIKPNPSAFVLTTLSEKERTLSKLGIQNTVYALFTPQFAEQSYEFFFDRILLGQLNARHIVIGFHYRFGKNAEGNAEKMCSLCARHRVTCQVIQPVLTQEGLLISSTAIRRSIIEGNRKLAEEMLGRKLLPNEERMLGGADHD